MKPNPRSNNDFDDWFFRGSGVKWSWPNLLKIWPSSAEFVKKYDQNRQNFKLADLVTDKQKSTLSLWHLTRAFTLENRWVRGSHFTDERSKLTNCRNFKKFFLDFSFLFLIILYIKYYGNGVPNFGNSQYNNPQKGQLILKKILPLKNQSSKS